MVFPKEQTREKKNLKILGRLSNRGKLYKTRVAQGCDSVHTNEKNEAKLQMSVNERMG